MKYYYYHYFKYSDKKIDEYSSLDECLKQVMHDIECVESYPIKIVDENDKIIYDNEKLYDEYLANGLKPYE